MTLNQVISEDLSDVCPFFFVSFKNVSHKALNDAESGNKWRPVWCLCPFFFVSLKNVSHKALNDAESGNKWRPVWCLCPFFFVSFKNVSHKALNDAESSNKWRPVWCLCPFFFVSFKNVSHKALNDSESGNKWRSLIFVSFLPLTVTVGKHQMKFLTVRVQLSNTGRWQSPRACRTLFVESLLVTHVPCMR